MNTGINEVKRLFGEKKFGEAVALLKDLAEQKNDPVAQFYLASLHLKGVAGVPKDIDAARQYLGKAADAGLADARKLLDTIRAKPAEQKPEAARQAAVNAVATQEVTAGVSGATDADKETQQVPAFLSPVPAPLQTVDSSRQGGENAAENKKSERVLDKSLLRLSRESTGAGDMLINVVGAMVVLLIVFRFVSSIFESPRTNYRQIRQQPTKTVQAQMGNNGNANAFNSGSQPASGFKSPVSGLQPVSGQVLKGIILNAYHSSADQEGSYVHSGRLAVDGNTSTCWSEGVKGFGIGENIEIHLNGNHKINGMNIWIGHQKSQQLFRENARPVAVRIIGSDGSNEVYNLSDSFGGQRVQFRHPITVNKVKVVVERVVPGTKYEDTCIAEINFF